MTFRKTTRESIIDGVRVPKDTLLYIPIRVQNTWTGAWGPDAEVYVASRGLLRCPTMVRD